MANSMPQLPADLVAAAEKIENPYWEEVKGWVSRRRTIGDLRNSDGSWHQRVLDQVAMFEARDRLVGAHCITVPSPETVAFVAHHAKGGLVDPMAVTGYWGYLLGQLGVDVVSSDIAPRSNCWHEVAARDGVEAVREHHARTLLLCWPPPSPDGARILAAYPGHQVIFIGEPEGASTGDAALYTALRRHWRLVACHDPIYWWTFHFAFHDMVWVWERGTVGWGSRARQELNLR